MSCQSNRFSVTTMAFNQQRVKPPKSFRSSSSSQLIELFQRKAPGTNNINGFKAISGSRPYCPASRNEQLSVHSRLLPLRATRFTAEMTGHMFSFCFLCF
ncbi:hypothetical protein OUZ56_000501 [Daphnia magna]|uniref:Uncharacterized protein n=1 Tax=Daphnia magna TaxID=35525 RepID=A0ABQ9ZZV9_9CRUS|nr:hypothetical protein OUZ56_000501 [Daphnia magna]